MSTLLSPSLRVLVEGEKCSRGWWTGDETGGLMISGWEGGMSLLIAELLQKNEEALLALKLFAACTSKLGVGRSGLMGLGAQERERLNLRWRHSRVRCP